ISISPTHKHSPHCVTRSHRREHHKLTLLKPAVVQRISSRERDRSGCCVSVFVNVFDHSAFIQTKLIGGCANDPQVSLMCDEEIKVVCAVSVALKYCSADLSHFAHCVLENRLTLLVNVVHFLVDRLMRGRVQTAAAGHMKKFTAGAVYFVKIVEYPQLLIVTRLKQHRSGRIAKKHARRTIVKIGDGGHYVRSD